MKRVRIILFINVDILVGQWSSSVRILPWGSGSYSTGVMQDNFRN